jgi:small conductance mechanosensitive channel
MDVLPILIAVLSALLGLLGGRMLQELVEHILFKPSIKSSLELNDSTISLIANGAKYVTYFLAFIVAISQFPVGDVVLNIIALMVIVAIIVVFLYSIKEFISNSFSGFLIARQKIFAVGDFLELNGVKGKVNKITLVFTEIELGDKSLVIIPNSTIVNRKIIKRQSD